MELLIKVFAIVDLAVIGLLGILAILRLMPQQVKRPVATRKQEKTAEQVENERSHAGTIQE